MTVHTSIPDDIGQALKRARRLEYLTIAYLLTAIAAIASVMGSSQAMKTAWFDDLFSVVPPIAFLAARRIAKRRPNREYPYGYARAGSIGYLASALALSGMGLFLLFDAVAKLVESEHPTIGALRARGHLVWLGWPMLLALAWSGVPAYFLGRAKVKLAEQLHDHGLLADAEINSADWKTAVAAALGVLGIGIGFWWADAVAASVIAFDILRDGVRTTKRAVADLMDRRPIGLEGEDDPICELLAREVDRMSWVAESTVRLRAEGHLVVGEVFVVPARRHDLLADTERTRARLRKLDWRVLDVVVAPVNELP